MALAFGRVLRTLRRKRKFTQKKLAEKSGCDRTYVSLLELGDRGPTLATVIDLAKGLKTSAGFLVSFTEEELKEGSQDK